MIVLFAEKKRRKFPQCTLDFDDKPPEYVKLFNFNERTFKRCCDALMFRKTKGLKYSELVLEDNMNAYKFHMDCYRKLTVLKRKYADAFSNVSLRSPENSKVSIFLKSDFFIIFFY